MTTTANLDPSWDADFEANHREIVAEVIRTARAAQATHEAVTHERAIREAARRDYAAR
jgi:hypothetical protein